MNVALAGVKLPPKRRLLTSKIRRNENGSPTSFNQSGDSKTSPTSPFSTSFARSPERSVSDEKARFDFSRTERAQLLQQAGGSGTNLDPETQAAVDNVDAPGTINTETWIRPTLLADTEVQQLGRNDEPLPISPMAIKAAEIRASSINWAVYLQGQIINQDHFDCMVILETYGKQKRDQLLQNHGHQCARLLLEMASNISKPLPVQYLLTLIDDFLQEDRNRVRAFHQYALAKDGSKGWTLFFPFLNREDLFTVQQAARIIAKLACWSEELMNGPELQIYFIFLKEQIRSTVNDYLESTARCLQMLHRIEEYRIKFTELDGIPVILTALKSGTNFQANYQLIFCLWCLSFNPEILENFNKYKAIPVLTEVLSHSQKEKITRIVLATLRNLLENPLENEMAQENALTMIHSRILSTLRLLVTHKFQDDDVLEDIQYLTEQLESVSVNISSYDEYLSEIKSGALEWSPVHKCQQFWRENASRFNEANYELLKILIRLLEVSGDPLVLSVAVHDIGEYVRFNPQGKKVVERLGGKDRAMAMLNHEDASVRYQALLAVQKMMVQNWEFLGKPLEREKESDKNKFD